MFSSSVAAEVGGTLEAKYLIKIQIFELGLPRVSRTVTPPKRREFSWRRQQSYENRDFVKKLMSYRGQNALFSRLKQINVGQEDLLTRTRYDSGGTIYPVSAGNADSLSLEKKISQTGKNPANKKLRHNTD